MRHHTTTLIPVARVGVGQSLDAAAAAVLTRIRANRGHTAAGSYLLGAPDGRLFVVAAGASTAQYILDARLPWLIGVYASRERAEYPTPLQLREDIAEHYRRVP